MAKSRALAAPSGQFVPEAVLEGEVLVTSARAQPTRISLPEVTSAGTGAEVPFDYELAIQANAEGYIEVLDFWGSRVCIVPGFSSVSLRSKDGIVAVTGDVPSYSNWHILWTPGQAHKAIANLSVTDSATTASASAQPGAYLKASNEAAVILAIQTVGDAAAVAAAVSYAEVEALANQIMVALEMEGLAKDIDESEGTDTLALADDETQQLVDDSERLVTSGRAHPTFAVLPEVALDGAGLAAQDRQSVKFVSTAGGPIFVNDFLGRLVTVVRPFSNLIVKSVGVAGDQWSLNRWRVDNLSTSEEAVKEPQPKVAPLVVTLPTFPTVACTLAASYTDADFNAAMDLSINNAFATFETAVAAANLEVETWFDDIFVLFDGLDVIASS